MNHQSQNSKISYAEACGFVALFLIFRAVTIFSFHMVSGGQELASDVIFHKLIINDPLGILKGTAVKISSYPPFQWVIEWPVFNFYRQYFGEMISYRMLMVSVEFFSFVVAIMVCMKAQLRKKMTYAILILFVLSPHQYFASIFFVQEDVISQLFMLLTILCLLHGKRDLSIVTMILGVLIAKIFFVVPLFYIVLFQGDRNFIKRLRDGILALVPLVAVYAFIIFQALNNGGDVPIRDFSPSAKYAGNFWVILINANPEQFSLYKTQSLMLTLAIQLCFIAVFSYLYFKREIVLHYAILLTVPLAFFFATFYNYMPEYLLILWPVAALMCTTVTQHILFAAVLSFAWAPRVTHGFVTVVEKLGTSAQARGEVVGPIVNALNFDYVLLNKIALIVQSIVYTILVVWLCFQARKFSRASTSNGN